MRDLDDAPLPGRQLPHNVEAEMALLGAILVKPCAYERVAGFLRPEHFALAEHRPIYDAICRLADQGRLADAVTMKSHLANAGELEGVGGVAYLSQLVEGAVTPSNAGEYGRLIHELYQRRELIAVADDVLANAYDWGAGRGGVDGLRASAEALRGTVDGMAADGHGQCLPITPPGQEASMEAAWLVKGLVPRTGLTVVFGPSGAGKSFVALDVAMAVSRGEPWRGRKTEQGAVLYLAPDGGGLFVNRIVAYCQRRGIGNGDHAVFSVTCGIDLLAGDDTDKVLRTIAQIERAHGVVVIAVVVDTASRAMPGGDENAAKDVTRLVDSLGRIGDGKRAVIAVHHSGKDLAQGMRGHSALHAAADCVLRVHDGQIKTDKSRDGAAGVVGGFRLDVVELGLDEDGEPVTSCVVAEAEASQGKGGGEGLSPAWSLAMRTIANLIAEHGSPLPQGTGFPTSRHVGVAAPLVSRMLRENLFGERTPGAAKKAWERLQRDLNAAGLIGVNGGWIWLPTSDRQRHFRDMSQMSQAGTPDDDRATDSDTPLRGVACRCRSEPDDPGVG